MDSLARRVVETHPRLGTLVTGQLIAVQEFCKVDVSALIRWVEAIPFEAWPQQHRVNPAQIRPAMANVLSWHGFGRETDPIVTELMRRGFDSGMKSKWATNNRMLSVVMPGEDIEPHSDNPGPPWRVRVHVPLATNDRAVFLVEDVPYHMEVGHAYFVNVRQRHEVRNDGATPRIHFMFDVVEGT